MLAGYPRRTAGSRRDEGSREVVLTSGGPPAEWLEHVRRYAPGYAQQVVLRARGRRAPEAMARWRPGPRPSVAHEERAAAAPDAHSLAAEVDPHQHGPPTTDRPVPRPHESTHPTRTSTRTSGSTPTQDPERVARPGGGTASEQPTEAERGPSVVESPLSSTRAARPVERTADDVDGERGSARNETNGAPQPEPRLLEPFPMPPVEPTPPPVSWPASHTAGQISWSEHRAWEPPPAARRDTEQPARSTPASERFVELSSLAPERRDRVAPTVTDDGAPSPWPELLEPPPPPTEEIGAALRRWERSRALREEQVGTRWSA